MPKKKSRKGISFVALERKLLHKKEWKKLPASEKVLYIHTKARYVPGNNGKIVMPYTAMRGVTGCSSPGVISAAFKGLIKKGWLKRTQAGGLYRKINMYELTFKYDNYDGPNINKDKWGR